VTENGIYQNNHQAKTASIAREFSGEFFDFDRLCASCLGGLVLTHEPSDSTSMDGAAWLIFGLTRSNECSAGGKHKEFSFERRKLVNCCDVDADSLFAAGMFGSILSLNNNRCFAGDKHASFSRGRDDCFEVDGEI